MHKRTPSAESLHINTNINSFSTFKQQTGLFANNHSILNRNINNSNNKPKNCQLCVNPEIIMFKVYQNQKTSIVKLTVRNEYLHKIKFKIVQPKRQAVFNVRCKKHSLNPKQTQQIFVFFNCQKQKTFIEDEFIIRLERQKADLHIPIYCRSRKDADQISSGSLNRLSLHKMKPSTYLDMTAAMRPPKISVLQKNIQNHKGRMNIKKRSFESITTKVEGMANVIKEFEKKFIRITEFINEKNVKKQVFIGQTRLSTAKINEIDAFKKYMEQYIWNTTKQKVNNRISFEYSKERPIVRNFQGIILRWSEDRNIRSMIYQKGLAKVQEYVRRYVVDLRFEKIHNIFQKYKAFESNIDHKKVSYNKKHEMFVQKLQKKLNQKKQMSIQLNFDKRSIKPDYLSTQQSSSNCRSKKSSQSHIFQINPRIGFDNWIAIEQSIPYNHEIMGYTKKTPIPQWLCYRKLKQGSGSCTGLGSTSTSTSTSNNNLNNTLFHKKIHRKQHTQHNHLYHAPQNSQVDVIATDNNSFNNFTNVSDKHLYHRQPGSFTLSKQTSCDNIKIDELLSCIKLKDCYQLQQECSNNKEWQRQRQRQQQYQDNVSGIGVGSGLGTGTGISQHTLFDKHLPNISSSSSYHNHPRLNHNSSYNHRHQKHHHQQQQNKHQILSPQQLKIIATSPVKTSNISIRQGSSLYRQSILKIHNISTILREVHKLSEQYIHSKQVIDNSANNSFAVLQQASKSCVMLEDLSEEQLESLQILERFQQIYGNGSCESRGQSVVFQSGKQFVQNPNWDITPLKNFSSNSRRKLSHHHKIVDFPKRTQQISQNNVDNDIIRQLQQYRYSMKCLDKIIYSRDQLQPYKEQSNKYLVEDIFPYQNSLIYCISKESVYEFDRLDNKLLRLLKWMDSNSKRGQFNSGKLNGFVQMEVPGQNRKHINKDLNDANFERAIENVSLYKKSLFSKNKYLQSFLIKIAKNKKLVY